MSLASNALITVKEFKALANLSVDNENVDDKAIEAFVNSASQIIEEYCNRKFITPSDAIAEIFDGDGQKDVYVEHRRIADTPVLEYWDGTAWQTMTTTQYPRSFDGDKGRVWLNNGAKFSTGQDNYRVTYKYGWVRASIPNSLKLTCAQITHRQMTRMLEGKEGKKQENFETGSTIWQLEPLSDDIKEALATYRRIAIG